MASAITICLPTKNNLTHLKTTLASLMHSTNSLYEIYILDAMSSDGTGEWLDMIKEKYKNIKVFREDTKSSIEACNFLMRQVKTGDVMLTQDDVMFVRHYWFDWLDFMNYQAEFDDIGILTGYGGMGVSGHEYKEGQRYVGTWFMYLPRRVIEKVGYFDEAMRIGEDIDYAYRVEKAGLKVAGLPLLYEHHQRRATPHQPQDEATIKEAGAYFRAKHKL